MCSLSFVPCCFQFQLTWYFSYLSRAFESLQVFLCLLRNFALRPSKIYFSSRSLQRPSVQRLDENVRKLRNEKRPTFWPEVATEKKQNRSIFLASRDWKCVRTLTKFPIKDLTFFTSLVRRAAKLKIRIRIAAKTGKKFNLRFGPGPETEAFSIGKKFDHK